MTQLTFNDVEEAKSSFNPTINPGIHEVIILGKELVEPEDTTKSKYLLVKFANVEGTREANIKFYLNDVLASGKTRTALDMWLGNMKHIANNCRLSEIEKSKIRGNSKYELLCSMIDICLGKPYRQKFIGEEYIDKNGKIQVKVGIGFPNFAESVDIPKNESKLLFKETDPYDYKRVAKPEVVEEVSLPQFMSDVKTPDKPVNDLPF